MSWIAFLLAAYMVLGLRRRTAGGSTHLTILVVTALGLLYAFSQMRT